MRPLRVKRTFLPPPISVSSASRLPGGRGAGPRTMHRVARRRHRRRRGLDRSNPGAIRKARKTQCFAARNVAILRELANPRERGASGPIGHGLLRSGAGGRRLLARGRRLHRLARGGRQRLGSQRRRRRHQELVNRPFLIRSALILASTPAAVWYRSSAVFERSFSTMAAIGWGIPIRLTHTDRAAGREQD